MNERGGSPVTAYDRLAERIRTQIVSGELRPGDQLPTEAELSAHYEVSRNTAREALRALASQGLLITRRGVTGGTFVSIPSRERISESLHTGIGLLADGAHLTVSELVEMREILEVPAAELAARRRTDIELDDLRRSLTDRGPDDAHKDFDRNLDFHSGLVRASHNPVLEVVCEPIFRVLKGRFLRERITQEFWAQAHREHLEILSHVEAGDQAGSREAMRAHLRYLRGVYEGIDRLAGN